MLHCLQIKPFFVRSGVAGGVRPPGANLYSARFQCAKLVAIAGISWLFSSGCLLDRFGGAFTREPEELTRAASMAARKLIDEAFAGLDSARLVDHHTHMLALGTSVKEAWVNPKSLDGFNFDRLKFRIYVSASGVRDLANADEEYASRLVRLARSAAPRGKFHILAFDRHYNADGSVNLAKTTMYVPNRYVVALAEKYPEVFVPVVSIHPYRADALPELERWAKAGVRYVKWLPNAMGMNPGDPVIEPFYRMMKQHRMILLSHAGEEQAVEADEDQKLGNPLLLRKPLSLGVRVVAAHAASLGQCADLDDGEAKKQTCFDLFLRLMDEAKYAGLLFGDISAMLQYNRMPDPLLALLKRPDLHSRLVNGSDYPLPAINWLIRTRSLARAGFITAEERTALNEIYDYNPLLFDFVLKRTLRHPETGQKLAPSIFVANRGLE